MVQFVMVAVRRESRDFNVTITRIKPAPKLLLEGSDALRIQQQQQQQQSEEAKLLQQQVSLPSCQFECITGHSSAGFGVAKAESKAGRGSKGSLEFCYSIHILGSF